MTCAIASAPAGVAEAQRLHVVVATDLEDRRIGESMTINREIFALAVVSQTPKSKCDLAFVPMFAPVPRELDDDPDDGPEVVKDRGDGPPPESVDPKVLEQFMHFGGRPELATRLSRDALLAAIQARDVGNDDALVVYYAGHGRYDLDRGNYALFSGGGTVYQREILQAMDAKRPRTAVLIMDCCNTLPPGNRPNAVSLPAPFHPAAMSPLFASLFFEERGTIAVTSSSPGEYALILPDREGAKQSSLFTNVFTEAAASYAQRKLGWNNFSSILQRGVDRGFAQYARGGVLRLGNGSLVPQKRQTIELKRPR